MLKVLILIQALCGASHAEAQVCKVRWATMPDGVESVAITGYHKDHVVLCRIIDTASAECDQDFLSTKQEG